MAEVNKPINVTAATLTLDKDEHGGAVVTINRAAAQTTTLPASTGDGTVFTIFVGTTITGAHVVQVANSSDVINGGVMIAGNIAGVTMLAAATTDTITFAADTTTGGIVGSWVRLTDAYPNKWMLEGFMCSTTDEATPFSAAV